MSDIIETNEYPSKIPLIEVGDKVEGGENGAANKQAIALAKRSNWLKTQVDWLRLGSVLSINNKRGAVTLNYSDVGADPQGTADSILAGHVNDTDPHSQYVTTVTGDSRYLLVTEANKANGYLQLDTTGKIPISFLQSLTARHVTVVNQAARLALTTYSNLTICAQADINTIFYLNGGDNPAVLTNWITGQSATVSGVSSVFGRTDSIVATAGDYNADQITETSTRAFVTPSQKATWSAKQDKLTAGSTIKNLFGQSLLGNGNLIFTPAQLGAATATHTHTTAEIPDFQTTTQNLVINSLEAGQNVTLTRNVQTGKTVVNAHLGVGDSPGFHLEDRTSIANQNHLFVIPKDTEFKVGAYALKEIVGATNQTYQFEDFSSYRADSFDSTSDIVFDNGLSVYSGGIVALQNDETDLELFKSELLLTGRQMSIDVVEERVVPSMTGAATPIGWLVSASESYSGTYPPYSAFKDGIATSSGWLSNSQPTPTNPIWIEVTLPSERKITGYRLRSTSAATSWDPTAWTFEGSNDNGATWDILDEITGGSVGYSDPNGKLFPLTSPVTYKKYRIVVTGSRGRVGFSKITLVPYYDPSVLMDDDGKIYTVTNSVLVEIPGPISNELVLQNGFTNSGIIPKAAYDGKNLSIVSYAKKSFNIISYPEPQIAVQKVFTDTEVYKTINTSTITFTQTGTSQSAIALSLDGIDWFVFKAGVWVNIGNLTANTAGANKLIVDGMTVTQFNTLTKAQWALIYDSTVTEGLLFAYALDYRDPTTETLKLTSFDARIDASSNWKLQTPAEVIIEVRKKSIIFRPTSAGNYKFGFHLK